MAGNSAEDLRGDTSSRTNAQKRGLRTQVKRYERKAVSSARKAMVSYDPDSSYPLRKTLNYVTLARMFVT